MNQDIKYPYAEAAGEVVHIDDADKKDQFICLGCEQKMRPAQGKKVAWHFRHLPDAKEVCDPDRSLHQMAQRIVEQNFNSAVKKEGQEYRLTLICPICKEYAIDRNVATSGATIKPEEVLVKRTRSDLVIRDPDGKETILEIVVTHDLEDETDARYRESGIPVLLKKFEQFGDLEGLDSVFAADKSLNVLSASEQCDKCVATLEPWKDVVAKAIARMVRNTSTTPRFKAHNIGRGHWNRRQRADAQTLSELGFEQSSEWLGSFGFLIHGPQGEEVYFTATVDSYIAGCSFGIRGLRGPYGPDGMIGYYIADAIVEHIESQGFDGGNNGYWTQEIWPLEGTEEPSKKEFLPKGVDPNMKPERE